MALALKTRGMEELKSFKQRIGRQHQLGRISEVDRKILVDLTNQLMAHVVKMREDSPDVNVKERRF
jgi:uncharacterized protein YaaR (DUF327 family)